MEAKHACHLGQELVLSKLKLGLMGVATSEAGIDLVNFEELFLVGCEPFLVVLGQVTFKHCVSHHIDVDHVIEDGVTKGFKLLVICGQLKVALC